MVSGQWITEQEGEVDDARQAGGRKYNKRGSSGQCELSRWQTMQGDGVEDMMCSSPFLSNGAAAMDDG